MFSIVLILLALLAANTTYGTGLFVVGVINAIIALWGNGVMLNFGKGEEGQMPDSAAQASMLTAVVSVGLLIWSVI